MKRLTSGTNFVRYGLGEIEVIALRDGYIDMPASRLRQAGNQPFKDLHNQVELVGGKLRLSVNAFLIIDGDEHILIDTGASNSLGSTMGELLLAFEEAGVEREKISTIALTHTHEDHAHGLVAADGSDAFPKLQQLFVARAAIRLFDKIERVARFRQLRTSIDGGFKLSSSVTAVDAAGHEVGHTAYEVSSAGETLIIWGDIVHVQSIQFDRPELTWEYDADQDMARSSRLSMLRLATRPNVYVAGAHLASPGVGKISENGSSFSYIPL
ncbi:MBL fold metallo-hydrolase [Phyllobacterium sp. 628]|uniref:MBL fold metallo-hydrolase n=1 Tax=Phyllobacterium sp. 628 TaxID=2718938 RepID=UPI0016627C0D|nr:MBL fold metallo-hydrolase [Phyllobacterium sp. 628]QND53266.1 MBL fold metallo-hydrolase [Phyllobacterium sp. 628]